MEFAPNVGLILLGMELPVTVKTDFIHQVTPVSPVQPILPGMEGSVLAIQITTQSTMFVSSYQQIPSTTEQLSSVIRTST